MTGPEAIDPAGPGRAVQLWCHITMAFISAQGQPTLFSLHSCRRPPLAQLYRGCWLVSCVFTWLVNLYIKNVPQWLGSIEQNESGNTVSADEKGRLKHCKFVFWRCNMYYSDAYGYKIQPTLFSLHSCRRPPLAQLYRGCWLVSCVFTWLGHQWRMQNFSYKISQQMGLIFVFKLQKIHWL